MKAFVYGRPAAHMGDRGYRVFAQEGLGLEETKNLKKLFTDVDPDKRFLADRHFKPFFVLCPWREGSYIFGKGKIETTGKLGAMYYSYLFHGVVLDEDSRAMLLHNPFILADYFDLEGDRTRVPRLPNRVEEKGYFLNLAKKIAGLASTSNEDQDPVAAAGYLARCLSDDRGDRPIIYEHDGSRNGDFWGMVLALLPLAKRKQFSLCTWAPFLNHPSQVMGVADMEEARDRHAGALMLPARGISGCAHADILRVLTGGLGDETRLNRLLRVYAAAIEDVPSNDDEAFKTYMEQLFRAVERPSVRSLREWPEAGPHLFETKATHFREVWRRHGPNAAEFFPDLADDLWAHLVRDVIKLGEDARPRLKAFYALLEPSLGPRTLFSLIREPSTASWFTKALPPQRFVSLMTHPQPDAEDFKAALELGRRYRKDFAEVIAQICLVLFDRLCKRVALADDSLAGRNTACCLEISAALEPAHFGELLSGTIYRRQVEVLIPFMNAGNTLAEPLIVVFAQRLKRDRERERAGRLNPSTEARAAQRRRFLFPLLRLLWFLKNHYHRRDQIPDEFAMLRQDLQDSRLLQKFFAEANIYRTEGEHFGFTLVAGEGVAM